MRRLLTVYDEGYVMWTLVVDEDKVEDISNLIKNSFLFIFSRTWLKSG